MASRRTFLQSTLLAAGASLLPKARADAVSNGAKVVSTWAAATSGNRSRVFLSRSVSAVTVNRPEAMVRRSRRGR